MSSQGSRRKGRSRPVVDATSFLCAAYCCCLQLLRLALRSLLGGFIGWSRTSAPQSVAAKFSRLTVWINQQVLEVTRWYDVDRCVIKPQTKAEAEAAAKAAARQHQKWQHLRSTKTTATKAASYLHVHRHTTTKPGVLVLGTVYIIGPYIYCKCYPTLTSSGLLPNLDAPEKGSRITKRLFFHSLPSCFLCPYLNMIPGVLN